MTEHWIVVIGASTGGVEALMPLVKQLPPDLNAALFVTVHFPANRVSFLPDILTRLRTLPATHAQDGETIQLGHIYITPPDYHLLIHPHTLELSCGPKENGHRPAIDLMFRSAAQAFGHRVIGVVLSGMLDDGTHGLQAVKSQGGIALVQDPAETMFRSMPANAIARVAVDQVLPLATLAKQIVALVGGNEGESALTTEQPEPEGPPEEKIVA
ncbi:chemotaxis protein CheB [Leptolyngbya sp. CCNP1308]|uniref:chemotaxis protein CheB n=1 Tax=Leptolyngbya sp. CCNP1308 TaxID=3110255 RepID=UPI002B21DE1D|nr:chemotaxis protein CheB [Leptolyngbya sp. CCNP1308]MEA5451816.1 chemotaxis protein CheB [Leptolyngbya sp. CCNP1308]